METTVPNPQPVGSAYDAMEISGRYELLEEVARGGMGVVFRARHRLLNQLVAIKFQIVGDGIDRFLREAKLLASVQSDNVVSIQDFEVSPDGKAMMVMKWIEGGDLDGIIKMPSEKLPEKRAIRWMTQVSEGMQAAAELGIVHRDLKPANIMIDRNDKALVADFGIARSTYSDPLTVTGGIMGTPLYMAPEQAEDPRTVDTRADIYSFGATFYHLLTSTPPFLGDSWFKVLLKHKTDPLVRPASLNPELSDSLNDCLERCLAKSPLDRFQSFGEILDELKPDSKSSNPWASDNEAVGRHWEKYLLSRQNYLGRKKSEGGEAASFEFPDGRTLTIKFGDIANENVDAIVSSDDESLSMGGGVSDHIFIKAGPEYGETARRYAPVRPGRVIVTPAGDLVSRFVFHAITMGQWGQKWVEPSRDLLNEIMEACFYHADTLGLRSIAFPLLGTGAGQFSQEVCLDTMFKFLIRKLEYGLTSLQDVRIVVFDHLG